MEDLNKLLKQAERTAKSAKQNLVEQQRKISLLPDGLSKKLLQKATEKAKSGDVEGVQEIIKKLQNAT